MEVQPQAKWGSTFLSEFWGSLSEEAIFMPEKIFGRPPRAWRSVSKTSGRPAGDSWRPERASGDLRRLQKREVLYIAAKVKASRGPGHLEFIMVYA